jgi:dUTP pyrophosphatase
MSGNSNPTVKFFKKDGDARIPRYETGGSSGADIRARISEAVVIPPLGRARIPTGLIMELPEGYEAQVRPRSGLAARHGLTILNAPGTIDSDYRGELEIILVNLGSGAYTVNDGDRIAQLVIAPVSRAVLVEAESLSETGRGAGGFGSTGI